MRFSKWHALGNSYLLVEEPIDAETGADGSCDVRYGIGSDGVLEPDAATRSRSGTRTGRAPSSPATGRGSPLPGSPVATAPTTVTVRAGGREYPARVVDGSSR